jgi:PadR family transcriptional regulator
MATQQSDILQGTLALLVLRTLSTQPGLHGYAISRRIKEVSTDLLRVEEGSLYPALHRMQQTGWLSSKWGITEKNRRARFYALTAAGKRQLAQEQANWVQITNGVRRVLRYA